MTQANQTTLEQILDKFREDARNKRDLGDRFEWLIHDYLKQYPLYADRFSDVWLWNDWPNKGPVGDVGIDLVARERATGEYCGIQCKFYLPEHTLSKPDIDSFFTALGKEPFTSGIIVSTTDKWGKNAEDALKQIKAALDEAKPVIDDLLDNHSAWSDGVDALVTDGSTNLLELIRPSF